MKNRLPVCAFRFRHPKRFYCRSATTTCLISCVFGIYLAAFHETLFRRFILRRFLLSLTLALIGLNASKGGASTPEVTEIKGTLVIRHYGHENEITDFMEGSFQLACTPNLYAIRMMKPTAFVEHAMFAISNGNSIYQSQKLRKLENSNERTGTPNPISRGKCQYGDMPLGFQGWGPMEALALSYHLLHHPDRVILNGELRSTYLPDIIVKRARELRRPYPHAEVLSDANGTVNHLRFWGLKEEKAGAPYSRTDDCFLLGELRIEDIKFHVAQKVFFVVNGLAERPVAGKPRYGSPIVDVEFVGLVTTSANSNLFSQVAYDADSSVNVHDSRFPDYPDLQYVIKQSDRPPLAQTDGPSNDAYKRRLASTARYHTKRRYTLLFGGVITLFLFAAAFLRTRAKK